MVKRYLKGCCSQIVNINYEELGIKIWRDIRRQYPKKRGAIIDSGFIEDQIKYHLSDEITDWYLWLLKNNIVRKFLQCKSLKRLTYGQYKYGHKDFEKVRTPYLDWKPIEDIGTIKKHWCYKKSFLYYIKNEDGKWKYLPQYNPLHPFHRETHENLRYLNKKLAS